MALSVLLNRPEKSSGRDKTHQFTFRVKTRLSFMACQFSFFTRIFSAWAAIRFDFLPALNYT